MEWLKLTRAGLHKFPGHELRKDGERYKLYCSTKKGVFSADFFYKCPHLKIVMLAKKEQMSADYRGFFQKQEEISKRCNDLDKEIFRLNNQREKLKEAGAYQTNYLWEEYELTPHAALELKNDIYEDLTALKKMVAEVKDEIRKLGDVNVNAIEEYKEVSERYQFLKTQHDDLVEAEQTLVGIIEDLDNGMRKQFSEKFAEIQKEFDASFKHLFGGGHGTLELVEDEDILE